MLSFFKTRKEYIDIDHREFSSKIKSEDPIVIDVRTPAEYRSGHIPMAINIDLSSSDFQRKISGLESDKSYLLYCRSGARSGVAAKLLARKGLENVFNLSGGLMNWSEPLKNS